MKKTVLAAACAMALLSIAPVNAQPSGSAGNGVQAQRNAPSVAEFDKQAAKLDENIKLMQEQMDKIRQTQDPQLRQKLLQDHWATMQSCMGMMQGMWGSGMMGCCGGSMMGGHMMGGGMMGWHNMRGYYSKLTPKQMKQRQYMMDRYMGMQQMMMDHMMQHQNYMMMQPPR